ncbi:hypothetical protein T10_3420, partial [Trichinella papuae]
LKAELIFVMYSVGDGEDQQSSCCKTLTADFTSKNSLGNSSSIMKSNFNVTHASLPDLSTCGVSCLVDQVDSVVENVVPKIPSYGLREFQQRFEDLRRENFSLKVSLSYAQLKLQELGATDVFFNGAESFDDLSAVKKQLAEKEIAFAKARKEWDREIQIRDEKIMSLREKQRTAERVYQEAEILKIKCENLQEDKEVYEGMLKELRLSYNLLLDQLKAANGSLCDDDGSESMVLMSKKEAIILDLKTTIAHLEAELDEKCNKLKQYANIDIETLENCIECKKIRGELELLEKKHNFEMEELEKQLRHAERNAVMWKETLVDLKLASDEKLPMLATSSESNESHAVSSEEEIDRLKMEVERERQKRIKREKVIIHIREKYFNGSSKSWNNDWQLFSKHSELLDSNFANTTMQNSAALQEIEPEFQSKLRQIYDRTKHLYSRLKSSAAALNESLKIEPKKDCTANGTTEIDGKGILEVPDVGLKERNAKLEKYIKLLKGKFKKLEKYLIIGEEEVQLSKNSSLTDLDRLDRVEMLLRSSDTREKQLSATIEQLEQNNERLAEYVRTIEATVDDQSCWKNRCLDLQRKYDLAKLKIETLQQALNNKEESDKSIIINNNHNNNGLLQKANGKSNNDPSDNNTNNIAASNNTTTAATAMDNLNTTTPTADKTMKMMDDLAELLTSSQKNISIAMNQFVKLLSESKKPQEQQVNLSKLIKDLKCSLDNVRTCNVSIGACFQDTNGSVDDLLIENKHLQQKVQELQQELDDLRGELCSTVKDFDDYKSLVSDANRDIKEDLKKTGKVLQKFKKK